MKIFAFLLQVFLTCPLMFFFSLSCSDCVEQKHLASRSGQGDQGVLQDKARSIQASNLVSGLRKTKQTKSREPHIIQLFSLFTSSPVCGSPSSQCHGEDQQEDTGCRKQHMDNRVKKNKTVKLCSLVKSTTFLFFFLYYFLNIFNYAIKEVN